MDLDAAHPDAAHPDAAHPDDAHPDDIDLDDIDLDAEHLADSAFWSAPPEHRARVFAALRRDAPVRWYPPRRSGFSRACTGFWALTRYADVWHASRTPAVFCSGVTIDIEEMPEQLGEFYPSMINLDDPQHARLRRLVFAGFTPRQTAAYEPGLRTIAAGIIDRLLERHGDGSEFDFVSEVAARLPLRAICTMLGVPEADQELMLHWTNLAVSPDDPSVGIEASAAGLRNLADYALELGRLRLADPTDDLTSVLMHAEVDGERLNSREFANFFILLISAGNETTRNAITHGLRLLTANPDQRAVWFDDYDTHAPTAVEEIVRYETLISNMCRVLTRDVELHGVTLREGEKVALWYPSANRDGTVFDQPDRFDVRRPMVPQQVGYGAGGPHFCLGANLARREMTVMFDEIRRRTPDLAATGEPERPLSMALNAIRTLPASIRP
jgi:cytochrome P450